MNNIILPSNRNLNPKGNQLNKKEIKLELNKLNIKSDERNKEKNDIFQDNEKSINRKVRPQSVKFQNV